MNLNYAYGFFFLKLKFIVIFIYLFIYFMCICSRHCIQLEVKWQTVSWFSVVWVPGIQLKLSGVVALCAIF